MDRYRLLGALGVGGAGRVVLVEDRLRPGSRLALKELLEADPENAAALNREFSTLATLRHPNLVEVHELEIDPDTGRSQLVMEHVDGDDIVTTIRKEGPASLPSLAAELLRAVAFLHDFGLVHRDLKPGNILVRRVAKAGHRVVLLDFGLAAQRSSESTQRSAGMAGTLPYMAPELFDGGAPTKRTDLYALGVVLHEAVHGKPPFAWRGNDITAFVAAVREGRRARPAAPAGYPAGLARWLDEMLSPDPADRPSSATDSLARLNEACGTEFALETSDDRAARLGSGEPVGRADELTALRLESGPSDAPRVAWLCGDAGSGKTRLLRFLASEAIGRGWRVHTPPGALPSGVDEFVERVRADAATAHTLVLLDELERADNSVATFVDRIAREPRVAPVHVVAAMRPGEVGHPKLRKLLADTGVVPSLVRIDLAPMGEAALKDMIERATAGRSSAQARVKWLLDASEGNAGAAEALLVQGVWEKHGKVPVAVALEQSIRRRLDSLSAEARAWMEALATLGDDAPDALVGELAGLEERASAAAEEAIASGLARRTSATALSPDSRRTTEAVKAAASSERLAQLHALAATHFAAQERDTFGATAWRLARLWRGAGDIDRALAAALDAASAAEVAKNWDEAGERLRFALTLLPRRDARRGALWMRRAEALRQALLHRDAVKAFGWAARWATDPEVRLEARARQARALFMAGRRVAALTSADRVLAAAEVHGLAMVSAQAHDVRSSVLLQNYDSEGSLASARAGLNRAGANPSEVRASLLGTLMMARSRLGQPGVEEAFAEARELLQRLGLQYQETMLLLARAMHEERLRRFSEEESWLLQAVATSGDHASAVRLRWISYQLGRVALMRGQYDRALDLMRAAEELALFSGDPALAANFGEGVIVALASCGRASEAVAHGAWWLDSGLLRHAPAQVTGTTLTHVLALQTAPDVDPKHVRVLMDGVASGLKTASIQIQLGALANEIAYRQLPGVALDASELVDKADHIRQATGVALNAFIAARLDLLCAKEDATRGCWRSGIDRANRLLEFCSGDVMPLEGARASFLLSDCLFGSGDAVGAQAARARGADFIDAAARQLGDPDMRRDFLAQPLVRELRARVSKPPDSRRLDALYDMIRALNSETDPEALLASIHEMAMKAVDAERGMILISGPTGADFSVRLSKNLEKETQVDAEAVSRRIVAAAEHGESILALDAGQDDRFKDFKSVSLFRIRSLMCVPLRSRGNIVGTVYLDSRRQGQLFSQDDLRFVEAFADHAALALENARKRAELENENRRLKAVVGERSSYAQIVGRSPAMQRVFDLLERIAPSDATVLIQGESGTGKELVARALHFNGLRKDKVFLSENCAAIAETLLESELFGHVRGAFTGAERDRAGVFEQAHGGTLFLDEIGDMSQAMQARLLRVLQEGELRRVGGDHPIKVDVRLIAATNKDLQAAVAAGRFREDLYYRLAVVPVQLPPLRERIGDVPLIAGHLLAQITAARGRGTPRIESDVLDALERYPWPGNVRQLENLLRRLALLAGDGPIDRAVIESDADLAKMLLGKQNAFVPVMSMEKSEEDQIRRALEAAAGNRDRAARLLGISRATIYRKMREYGLR